MPNGVRVQIRTRSGSLIAEGSFDAAHKGLAEDGTIELVGDCADGRRVSVRIDGEVLEEIDGPAIAASIRERGQRAENAVLERLRL